jgi:hypothetical protein
MGDVVGFEEPGELLTYGLRLITDGHYIRSPITQEDWDVEDAIKTQMGKWSAVIGKTSERVKDPNFPLISFTMDHFKECSNSNIEFYCKLTKFTRTLDNKVR